MTTRNYTIELPAGYELSTTITVGRGPICTRAHSTVFDADARESSYTMGRAYMDYCDAEILALELAEVVPALTDDAHEYVSAAGLECECDDD